VLLTVIERAMFSDGGTHAVTAFAHAATTITLSVAPWTDQAEQVRGHYTDHAALKTGHFPAARLLHCTLMDDDLSEGQQPPLPWDILGFDTKQLGQERWSFVLCCQEIEYVWESSWPLVESPG